MRESANRIKFLPGNETAYAVGSSARRSLLSGIKESPPRYSKWEVISAQGQKRHWASSVSFTLPLCSLSSSNNPLGREYPSLSSSCSISRASAGGASSPPNSAILSAIVLTVYQYSLPNSHLSEVDIHPFLMRKRDTDTQSIRPALSVKAFWSGVGARFRAIRNSGALEPEADSTISSIDSSSSHSKAPDQAPKPMGCLAETQEHRGSGTPARAPLWRSPASRSGPGVAANGWPGGDATLLDRRWNSV